MLTDDEDESKALIQGLEKPVNSCFDKHNELLYVCDAGTDGIGFIYQYDISYSPGKTKRKCPN